MFLDNSTGNRFKIAVWETPYDFASSFWFWVQTWQTLSFVSQHLLKAGVKCLTLVIYISRIITFFFLIFDKELRRTPNCLQYCDFVTSFYTLLNTYVQHFSKRNASPVRHFHSRATANTEICFFYSYFQFWESPNRKYFFLIYYMETKMHEG